MRRRCCFSTQRASSVLATWAAAYTNEHRFLSSPAAAATTKTDTASPSRPDNGSGSSAISSGATSAKSGGAAKANITDAAQNAAAGAAPAVESATEATEQLRAALRVLSVIERAKSDEQKLKLSSLTEAVTPIDVEPEGEEATVMDTTTTSSADATHANARNSNPAAGSTGTTTTTTGVTTGARGTAAPSVSWTSATSSWIRNKRPKFWAIVNEAGGDDDEPEKTTTPHQKPNTTATTAAGTKGSATPTARPAESDRAKTSTAASSPLPHHEGSTQKTTCTSPPSTDDKPAASLPSRASATESPASSSSTAAVDSVGRAAPVSAESIRAASSVPPFRNRYKKDVAHALSELLNVDPALGPQLLGQLSPESRRLMLIMGTASEYFGVDYGEVAEQIKEADTDRDNSISSKEFDAWVGHMAGLASTRRHEPSAKTGADNTSPSHLPSPSTAVPNVATAAAPKVVASSAPSTQTASDQRVSEPTNVAAAPPTPTTVSATPPSAAAPPYPAESGGVYVSTVTSGPSPHVVAPSATLSRQRAEMAISTARAASARIIEVMQKNVTPASVSLSSSSSTAGVTAAAPMKQGESAQQTVATTKSAPLGSPFASSSPASVKPPTRTVAAAAPPNPTGLTTTKAPSTSATLTQEAAPTKCADATAATTSATAADVPPKVKKGDPAYIPWPTFAKVVLAAAPPFLAFGMLDNCTLVLAGGAIDNVLSAKLGLTQMAAASLGGVVSGVAGIQVHGLAERFTRAKPPPLTPEQQRSDTYQRAENVGNTLGMVVGLVIGMTPLFFMGKSTQSTKGEEAAAQERFHEEAARSRQRRHKKTEKAESQERQTLVREEQATREAMLKAFKATPSPSA